MALGCRVLVDSAREGLYWGVWKRLRPAAARRYSRLGLVAMANFPAHCLILAVSGFWRVHGDAAGMVVTAPIGRVSTGL